MYVGKVVSTQPFPPGNGSPVLFSEQPCCNANRPRAAIFPCGLGCLAPAAMTHGTALTTPSDCIHLHMAELPKLSNAFVILLLMAANWAVSPLKDAQAWASIWERARALQ